LGTDMRANLTAPNSAAHIRAGDLTEA